MKNKRNNYTDEFKSEAVKLVTEQGYKISEAARNLGINESVLRRWKKESEQDNDINYKDLERLKAIQASNSNFSLKFTSTLIILNQIWAS